LINIFLDPKTHSIILYEYLVVREESMTKNGNFGQNRQNRSTSNACRIAGNHNSFRFFSLKTYIYHSWTKKTSNRMFPMAAILPINSQVTMAKWQQSLLSPDGFKPWNFFHLKRILLWSFWVVSRLKKSKNDDFRPLLVF
jgi:hypothetical protein